MTVALLVVDLLVAFTDARSPVACDCDGAVAVTAQLLAAARYSGAPVAFTTVAYDADGLAAARAFVEKNPVLTTLRAGSPQVQIDGRIAPVPGEPVIVKRFASAFFRTPLADLLTELGCTDLVVAGASTSGCVRATVVDAIQHGFRAHVPREAVADRSPRSHEVALLDIQSRYGEVVTTERALALLR